MNGKIAPGCTIGILGSGQLGRMLAMAAARLGVRSHVYAPESGPAVDVAAQFTHKAYDDAAALAEFAAGVALVTYEFENVPSETAEIIAAHCPVLPGPGALATTQDRLVEKQFLNGLGIETAPYVAVDDPGSLARAVAQLGRPSILKTRRFGYDGKGQATVREGSDLPAVFRALGSAPCILEGMVPFSREVSVVAARSADGGFAAWDVCENEHSNHVLSRTLVPARIGEETARQAIEIVHKVVDGLDYTGVIAVEMFAVEDASGGERLLVNEIAPRVHNSGHWTIDGAVTCQFEQHIRAICGWPLGSTRRHGRIEMSNLLGEDVQRWRDLLGEGGACLHIYGKHEARAGRKMGHVTRVFEK
ncbi:MAG: 5-(carboxyamino)imidazole ribonucleotide synthase [Hyphomicrobiales bacterium]|nr:5-(carboxyamino)imidazole ribonucleotide synthase [Hyphomicrobiales bacterium]